MLLNKIVLQNIGPHKNTVLEFDKFGPAVAITGSNGSGKSFLLDSVFALFYGVFPTRPGSIYDRVTKGFKGTAEIRAIFSMNGKEYEAVRTLKAGRKRPAAEAWLYELIPQMIQGTGLSQEPFSKAESTAIAGPKVDDFERKIETLIGSKETFLASVFSSQKNTGDICDAKPTERKALFAQMLGLQRFDQLSEAAKEKSKDLCQQEDLDSRTMDTLQGEVEALKKGAENLTALENQLNEAEEAVRALGQEIKTRNDKFIALEHASKTAQDLLRRKEEANARAEDATAEKVKQELEAEKITALLAKAQQIQADVKELELLRAAETAMAKAKEAHHQHTIASNNLTAKIAANENRIILLKQQAGLIDQIPNQEYCRTCKLAASAYEARQKIAPVMTENDSLKQQLTALKAPQYSVSRHEDTKRRILELAPAERQLGQLEGARERLASIQEYINSRAKAAEAAAKESADLLVEYAKYKDTAVEREHINKELLQLNSSMETAQNAVANINQKIGQSKAVASQINKKEIQIAGILVKLTAAQARIRVFDTLAVAFGKSGIQPLIIDSARPQFEDLTNDMLGTATDGRLSVRFDTQKTLKSGDQVESMEIIVTRDGFEQTIEEFSGGEQKLIRTVIRLTLSIYQSLHSHRKLSTIFIDEIFDALDADNSERIIRILDKLRDYFSLTVLVSHSDWLLQDMPAKINLVKGIEGTKVEVLQ